MIPKHSLDKASSLKEMRRIFSFTEIRGQKPPTYVKSTASLTGYRSQLATPKSNWESFLQRI